MLVENLIVLFVVISLGYVGLRLLSVIISRVAATKGLRHTPFLVATTLIVGLLSLIMFSVWGGKGLFFGWTFLVCFAISLYFANEVYRKIIIKAFNAISRKTGNTTPSTRIMLICELIALLPAVLTFALIGTTFVVIAKILGIAE